MSSRFVMALTPLPTTPLDGMTTVDGGEDDEDGEDDETWDVEDGDSSE
jgi:hypothetical protein